MRREITTRDADIEVLRDAVATKDAIIELLRDAIAARDAAIEEVTADAEAVASRRPLISGV